MRDGEGSPCRRREAKWKRASAPIPERPSEVRKRVRGSQSPAIGRREVRAGGTEGNHRPLKGGIFSQPVGLSNRKGGTGGRTGDQGVRGKKEIGSMKKEAGGGSEYLNCLPSTPSRKENQRFGSLSKS